MKPSFGKRLTPEARTYAIRELARRARVQRDFFNSWKIEVGEKDTVLTLGAQSRRVIFRHAPEGPFQGKCSSRIPVALASWMAAPSDEILKADLVLPFVTPSENKAPLFLQKEEGTFVCQLDVLLSTVFTLARVEEMFAHAADPYGRFPASASVAAHHGFLERPIVDEYGTALAQVIKALLPAWDPIPAFRRVKVTHDIDNVGFPFQLRTAIGHTIRRRRPAATIKDAVANFTGAETTELGLVRELAEISKSRGLRSAFFWKGSPAGPHDSGYDPFHPKIQRVIADLKREGFEQGVHPGYDSFGDRSRLRTEVELLTRALGTAKLGGRQHYLRWTPQTWLDWEACGLVYDSTLGFADAIGFRAGTSVPYRPWQLEQNRELNLIEVPLTVMDCTTVKYMALSKPEALARIRECAKRVALANGVFTLLWHNSPLIDPEYDGWYEPVLDSVASDAKDYQLPCTPAELW